MFTYEGQPITPLLLREIMQTQDGWNERNTMTITVIIAGAALAVTGIFAIVLHTIKTAKSKPTSLSSKQKNLLTSTITTTTKEQRKKEVATLFSLRGSLLGDRIFRVIILGMP